MDGEASGSSINIVKEINEENGETEDSATSIDQKLQPTKVYISPLLTVRSLAHQKRIRTVGNNIYFSVLSSESELKNSDWVNFCRICHGGESIGDLLSPCQCRGSIAFAHLECLERWLKESSRSHCEICRHQYQIIRRPRYGIFKSIFEFLRYPGEHVREIVSDLFGFVIYTSSTFVSTYMLSLLCESIVNTSPPRHIPSQIMTLSSILGIAAIDFAYTSWLLTNYEKHANAWRSWYRNHCDVKVILSASRKRITYSAEALLSEQD